jgi:nucleoside-diphosphate-sugar epimerase
MRVFITGASGFIGSAVVRELINAGHQVLGLARSEESAKLLIAAGAGVHHGTLDDTGSLTSGAAQTDAVIHLAFYHDFSKFAEAAAMDRLAIESLGEELAGSDRPLIVTAGIGPRNAGQVATEDSDPIPNPHLPRVSEPAALALLTKGVRVSVVRLPQVHDPAKHGLVSMLIAIAQAKGVSAYIEDGLNRWAAAHVLDTALLYRLVLENGSAGRRYHAVGEEGVSLKDIASAIGTRLKLPVVSISKEEAAAHFGWLAMPAGTDMPASSALTQEWLGWHPTHEGMIADLAKGGL